MKLRMLLRFIANRLKTFFIYRVLHVDDTPHRIALGVAAGIFIAWTPTIGFQMLLTILLAIAWLIVLVYRVLVFLLDMHADIVLLPEAASRIVLGYYEGRKK